MSIPSCFLAGAASPGSMMVREMAEVRRSSAQLFPRRARRTNQQLHRANDGRFIPGVWDFWSLRTASAASRPAGRGTRALVLRPSW